MDGNKLTGRSRRTGGQAVNPQNLSNGSAEGRSSAPALHRWRNRPLRLVFPISF